MPSSNSELKVARKLALAGGERIAELEQQVVGLRHAAAKAVQERNEIELAASKSYVELLGRVGALVDCVEDAVTRIDAARAQLDSHAQFFTAKAMEQDERQTLREIGDRMIQRKAAPPRHVHVSVRRDDHGRLSLQMRRICNSPEADEWLGDGELRPSEAQDAPESPDPDGIDDAHGFAIESARQERGE